MEWRDPIPDPDADRVARFPKVPKHVAIIMDGNGRWAEGRHKARIKGHWEGANRVDDITTECAMLGIPFLTLYAFSTENWNRPANEVSMLMEILVHYLRTMEKKLVKNRITLVAQGTLDRLPARAKTQLDKTREITSSYVPRMVLNLSLSYGAHQEITDAVKAVCEKAQLGTLSAAEITPELIRSHFYQPRIPDPDLLIRSGGESRLSNFLLWQAAYSELYVTDTLWPDFREEGLHKAIESFYGRERRFGKISSQLPGVFTEEGHP